jgi:hypothetical protein
MPAHFLAGRADRQDFAQNYRQCTRTQRFLPPARAPRFPGRPGPGPGAPLPRSGSAAPGTETTQAFSLFR